MLLRRAFSFDIYHSAGTMGADKIKEYIMACLALLPVELIRTTNKKRRGVSPHRIREIEMEIERGDELLPIRVHALGDGTYIIKEGRHRFQAHIALGLAHILAIVENLIGRMWRCLRLWCRAQ
jgi:hypothetical protein